MTLPWSYAEEEPILPYEEVVSMLPEFLVPADDEAGTQHWVQ